jgi:hypothetical protein
VHTVILAYNKHHALIIRPDDVWLAILTQISLFVSANAELLRASFVAHEGAASASSQRMETGTAWTSRTSQRKWQRNW